MEVDVTQVIRQFDVKAGDIVVLSHPGRLSAAGYDRLVEHGKSLFPTGIKIWILEEGATVDSVLSNIGGKAD